MAEQRKGNPGAEPADELSPEAGDGFALSHSEKDDVEENLPPRAAVLHEIIRRAGEVELNRSVAALGWSALGAGLSMGFSMLVRGVLHRYTDGMPAAALIEGFGYCFGFLVVILSRQQLFTENTMTVVLPTMTEPSLAKFGCLLRLWSVVLLGNLIGVALFAYGLLHLRQFDSATEKAFVAIGEELMHNSPFQMFTKAILAGWLISTMVWMLAATERSKVLVIILTTYVIAISGFTHIIVGSVETLYLVFAGQLTFHDYVFTFALPTLAGNIVGGSLIFALISHAQVRSDVN
ncbi:MAG: formate/nitrite transporter family protein [Pseudomonadota bacterium]|nr:formate/nitrite transporter family protein [Pseudomonadota bacterium]